MPIKDLLVYLDNDDDCADRIQAAVDLSRLHDAHLVGVYFLRTLEVPPYPYAYVPATAYENFEEDTERWRDEAQALFSKITAAGNINGEFRSFEGQVIKNLSMQSRYADLLVAPRQAVESVNLNREFWVSDVLLHSACPVLVLPGGQYRPEFPPQQVLVAWDGGHECARALKAGLPMMGAAKHLDVVSVSSDETEAQDIALHLSRHGFETRVHIVGGSQFNAGDALLKQATYLGSNLVVMGAYGHSRLREHILGGATRHVLDNTELPVLFSH